MRDLQFDLTNMRRVMAGLPPLPKPDPVDEPGGLEPRDMGDNGDVDGSRKARNILFQGSHSVSMRGMAKPEESFDRMRSGGIRLRR
jgi:hypothetical protein